MNYTTTNTYEDKSTSNTLYLIMISTVILGFIIKYFMSKKKQVKQNVILIIGPSNSGKTCFFYYLIKNDHNVNTVTSMEINQVEEFSSPHLDQPYDILDIPGLGFYKSKIIDYIPRSSAIIVFLDSTEKQNISIAAEYLYDILNSDSYNDSIPLIIACNKQDLKFPKSKKIIESDLTSEIENIKLTKQKNNLDDNSQIGTLFSMKTKFSFSLFKNIHFVESDKTSNYKELINTVTKQL